MHYEPVGLYNVPTDCNHTGCTRAGAESVLLARGMGLLRIRQVMSWVAHGMQVRVQSHTPKTHSMRSAFSTVTVSSAAVPQGCSPSIPFCSHTLVCG